MDEIYTFIPIWLLTILFKTLVERGIEAQFKYKKVIGNTNVEYSSYMENHISSKANTLINTNYIIVKIEHYKIDSDRFPKFTKFISQWLSWGEVKSYTPIMWGQSHRQYKVQSAIILQIHYSRLRARAVTSGEGVGRGGLRQLGSGCELSCNRGCKNTHIHTSAKKDNWRSRWI